MFMVLLKPLFRGIYNPISAHDTMTFHHSFENLIFRYFVLVILLIRGATLPGAYEGILFYVYPTAEKMAGLANIKARGFL